jgi:hypothetical protein
MASPSRPAAGVAFCHGDLAWCVVPVLGLAVVTPAVGHEVLANRD